MPASSHDSFATHWPDSAAEVPLQPVARLIYASISQVDGPVLVELRRIRDHALAHNGPQGLRVALLHISGWFVEWIEGPEAAIDDLLLRLENDARHHSLKVLHRSTGRPRLFKPWIGAIVQTPEKMVDVARRVLELQYRHEQGGAAELTEPASVWLSLCSPPGPDMPLPVGTYPRVMLLSARGARAFDVLHWLAQQMQRSLVRRRFAGGADDAPDVESDYLDLPPDAVQGRPGLRLIANARKGLAMGMTHAFLPDYATVVLLLDADPAHNHRLADRVLKACRQVHHAPLIVGVGAPDWVTPELKDLVERQGLAWLPVATGVAQPEVADVWGALSSALVATA